MTYNVFGGTLNLALSTYLVYTLGKTGLATMTQVEV